MKALRNQEGFTLIELMIVVVIIGILAAIAIPNFLAFQLKSKSAEGGGNLGGIQTAELAFQAKNGVFVATDQTPAGAASSVKQAWSVTTNEGFDVLGWEPTGSVFFVYCVGNTGFPVADTLACAGTPTSISAANTLDNSVASTTGIDIAVQAQADLDDGVAKAGDDATQIYYNTDENKDTVSVPAFKAGETVF